MRARPLQLLLAAAATASAAHAQKATDDGPVVVGESRGHWKAFDLQRLNAGIEFLGRHRSDKLSVSNEPDRTDTETLLRELFGISGQAYIGHKNLIDLTGSARLGLEDRFLDSDTLGAQDHSSDFSNLFDLNAHFLANSKVPFDLYTRREEQFLDQDFSSSLTTTTFETGAAAHIQSGRAPTNIRAFHLETDQNDQLGLFDYSLVQNTFAAQSNLVISERHRLEVQYSFDDVSETRPGGFENDYLRHDLLLSDVLNFDAKLPRELRSYLRYFNQDGDSGQEILRLDEQLLLTHTDRFESRYNFSAERQARGDADQSTVRGSALLRHKLFESLVSTGSVGGQWLSSSSDFTSNEWFVQGGLEYTKKVPRGRLNASIGGTFTTQHNGEQGGTLVVIDEPHTFNDPFPIILSRRNIVQGSVVVTAAGGFPTYQENVEYTIDYFADRAEIRVIVGSGISDGQTLLIDYDVGPVPASDIDTLSLTASARYTVSEGYLRGISIYSIYRSQDHSLDAADPSRFVLDDTTNLLYGIEYRREGLHLRAERESHDSTVNPYDTTRLQAFYDYRFSRGSSLGLDATHEIIDYTDPVNQVTFSRLSARWNQKVAREFDLTLRVDFRDESNDLRGDTQGIDQSLSLRWRRRQTSAYATIRNTLLETGESDRVSQFFELGLRRDF
ncbi:hypothetical protein PHYC_00721 [Phycisphaerales bacterium]|nr:hypothetical protein PHYC_00721 [Phycisphaerales bacterium]